MVPFSNASSNDMIQLGRTLERAAFAFPFPRWTTGDSIRCIYNVVVLNEGDTAFRLRPYDVKTGTGSTAEVSGIAIIVMP